MVAGGNGDRNGQQFIPGRILVRNVNVGRDESDRRFQILRNVDSGLEFRCKRGFDDVRNNQNPYNHAFRRVLRIPRKVLYPVIVAPSGNFAYAVAPPLTDYVFSGQVVPDLCHFENGRDYGDEKLVARSTTFDPEGSQVRRDRYFVTVHTGPSDKESIIAENLVFPGLVYKVCRQLFKGILNEYKNISVVLLGYLNQSTLGFNLRDLEKVKLGREDFWWHHVSEIPGGGIAVFERITIQEERGRRLSLRRLTEDSLRRDRSLVYN